MTSDNLAFDNAAFNTLMVRVVVTIFAAMVILLVLGVMTRPAAPAMHSVVAQRSGPGHAMTVSSAARPQFPREKADAPRMVQCCVYASPQLSPFNHVLYAIYPRG